MLINDTNYSLLKLISSLSGYMHDFGKANTLFQSKIRGNEDMSDIIRHEFLSFYIVLKLVEQYEDEIKLSKNINFITKNKWEDIFKILSTTYDKEYTIFISNLKDIFKIKNNYYSFNIDNNINPITSCILLSILTHHKLPLSSQSFDKSDMTTSLMGELQYYNLNRIHNIEEKDIKKLKKNIQLYKNYYINKDLEKKINEGFKEIYSNFNDIKNYSLENKKLFFKSFSMLSRIFLIMSDHQISSIKKRELPIINNNNKDSEFNKVYANTNRDFNDNTVIPTFNQTLDEHLLDVGNQTKTFLDELSEIDKNLPTLSDDKIKTIMEETIVKDFEWQNAAVKFIDKYKNNEPTLILNMATTGSGKTRMNVKALCALKKEKLRFTSVFNLKSLTLQTGDAYKNQLNLENNDVSVLIGDKNYLDIQTLNEVIEDSKLDNDNSATETEYVVEGSFKASTNWNLTPSFISNNYKNGYNIADFIGVPVLVSTIDFCINAGDLSKGSNHNNAFLRIMTTDLIIDEIDSYEPEMLESVLRLITISSMNKRNIIISSATLSKNYILMIKKAFEHGIALGNMLYGNKNNGKIICISNLVDGKEISTEKDIDSYIECMCHKFSENKQKLASILPMNKSNINSSIKENLPLIFQTIKSLHLNNHQSLEDKKFSFGLIRVGKIKHAIQFAKKYITTNFNKVEYQYKNENENESIEVKVLTYHSNLLNSKRFILEQFLDKTLNQNSKKITNQDIEKIVKESKAKHVIFIIIATPVEEIGRDHDFHWAIIEPSSIQSIIQTAGRVNRHRKINVEQPNIYILQYNLSYFNNDSFNSIYFTKPGLEIEENKYEQNVVKLLECEINNQLYITSELRYKSKFAYFDDKSIAIILNDLNYKFENNNNWLKMEYYLLNKLRAKENDTITYVVNVDKEEFFRKNNDKIGNYKKIENISNIHNNILELSEEEYRTKIFGNLDIEEWSNQTNVSIYNDKQKEDIQYDNNLGFYFEKKLN